MVHAEVIQNVFSRQSFLSQFDDSDCIENPAALSDSSLNFILNLCSILSIKSAFEFGSGRSTKALLEKGISVTSLEDNDYWMKQTLNNLTKEERTNHSFFVKPLKTRFLGMFPVKDWQIDDDIEKSISNADLILVDSPYYTPFRESTLWTSLKLSNSAVIILDDTRIPTLKRFCNRLKFINNSLIYVHVGVGHGFGVFYRKPGEKVHLKHSAVEVIKGWYRYFQGIIFYHRLKKL